MTFRLGRLPRGHDPRIPHLSALRLAFPDTRPGTPTTALPDWLTRIPDLNVLGMMENDRYGCCVEAGSYHALQVLSSQMNPDGLIITEPDLDVLKAYELATGFDPTIPGSDQGTDMQTYLQLWLTTGIPTGQQAESRHRCVGYAEIDPRNHLDVRQVIEECGFVYVGFEVPNYIMGPEGDAPLATWVGPAAGDDTTISGGHCVIGVKETLAGLEVISWGAVYTMGWDFWDRYVDEAYAVVDRDWGNAKGTPFGIPLPTLAAQMHALSAPPRPAASLEPHVHSGVETSGPAESA